MVPPCRALQATDMDPAPRRTRRAICGSPMNGTGTVNPFGLGTMFIHSNINPAVSTFATNGSNGQDSYSNYAVNGGYQWIGDDKYFLADGDHRSREPEAVQFVRHGRRRLAGPFAEPVSHKRDMLLSADQRVHRAYQKPRRLARPTGPRNDARRCEASG